MEYGVNEDYLDDDDDGIMYSTKTYSSDSEDDNFSVFVPSKSKKKCKRNEDSSDEDEFEKEMAAELNATMKKLTTPSVSSTSNEANIEETYYDKIYFDSDEENDNESDDDNGKVSSPKKRKSNQKVLTNDELFYDPLMDDEDQAWVDRNRRKYQVRNKKMKNSKGEPQESNRLPHSDAVLNCPACFTTLCLDCQRHEIYKNQYRAMFVFNCVVDKSEVLHFALKEDKKKKFKKFKKKKSKKPTEEIMDAATCPDGSPNEGGKEVVSIPESQKEEGMEDTFNPVKCQFCSTKVAVQDKDEVYHFFNVLSSY